jgi:hypothetical protein
MPANEANGPIVHITQATNGPLNAIYDREIDRIKEAHPEINTDQLHPFIVFTGGNFDRAAELYLDWKTRMRSRDRQQQIDRKQTDLGNGWGA